METEVAVPAEERPEVIAETPETPEELTSEQIAELKKKADVSSQNFERAKKAEADLREAKRLLEARSGSEIKPPSAKEIAALAKVAAEVHEDDIEEVLDWAAFKKIPVTEAKNQLKARLQEKAEQRKSAEAANISPARRGPTKLTDDQVLERASKGDLPESDEEISRLVSARLKTRQ